jgi:uncharacterized phage protein (TIGR01671 family)
MRKIEFRGKVKRPKDTKNTKVLINDKKDGEWVYGDLEIHRKDDKVLIHLYNKDGEYYRKYYVNPDTIGQFTGMLDKHGKEIYEGDIVRYWAEDTRCINPDCDAFNHIYELFLKKIVGVVSFEDGMFFCEDYTPLTWCGLTNLEELRNELNVTEEDGWNDCDGNIIDESKLGIEIIGNIYDNPELI